MTLRRLGGACAALLFLAACTGQEPALEAEVGDLPPVKEYPPNEAFEILPDRVVQNDKSAVVTPEGHIVNTYERAERTWRPNPEVDVSDLPQFSAPAMPIVEVLYRMALQEAKLNIREDGAFMAGEKWPGVWTRDLSYAIHLSLGLLLPENAKISLVTKTNRLGQIVQDTGTGGSWPLSTDRVVWALAAWETYLATGERAWLETAYPLMAATAAKDRAKAFHEPTGLYHGETSFTDWREQTYPRWMQPNDIYESQGLSTNVLHFQLNRNLALMGRALGKPAAEVRVWEDRANALAQAISRSFTVPGETYLGNFRYSPYLGGVVTDKADTLGNALAVLLGVLPTERRPGVMEGLPVVHFGPPIIYPQHAHANPYHNKGIWPFVTAYYGLAGKSVFNEAAFDHAFKSNVRAAALFITHKENLVYDSGHWRGTAVNSDRQVWSVAGYLGQVIKGLMGVSYDETGLGFAPMVPAWVQGPLSLTGLKWRGAVLDVSVTGHGAGIARLVVDGVERPANWRLPASHQGAVKVEIELTNGAPEGRISLRPTGVMGPRDVTGYTLARSGDGVRLNWRAVATDATYRVYKNGQKVAEGLTDTFYEDTGVGTAAYQVQPVGADGTPSNLSEPLWTWRPENRVEVQAESGTWTDSEGPVTVHEGYTGTGFILAGKVHNGRVPVAVPAAGRYLVRWRFSNGHGPINTDNKAAIRTLTLNGRVVGTVVLPQTAGWENWTWSNHLFVDLPAGEAVLGLDFTPEDENMNLAVNQAAIDAVELIRL